MGFLNRMDLVKQFELVVKQEIKNHQDSILQTNLAINALNTRLDELQNNLNRVSSTHVSHMALHNSSFLEIEKNFRVLESKIYAENAESKGYHEEHQEKLKKVEEHARDFFENVEWLKATIHSLLSANNERDGRIDGISRSIADEIERLGLQFAEKLQKTKQELLDLPSEAQQVKKELEEKMHDQKIDFLGCMREIEVGKKTIFIIEKHIENLYTQIQRSKK